MSAAQTGWSRADVRRDAGMAVCCGGIIGLGEPRGHRIGFVQALATLPRHPESVTVKALMPIRSTPLGDMLADATSFAKLGLAPTLGEEPSHAVAKAVPCYEVC